MEDLDLGRALVSRGLLTEDELREALEDWGRTPPTAEGPPRLADLLVQRGYLSRRQISEVQSAKEHGTTAMQAMDTMSFVIGTVPPEVRAAREDPARVLGKYVLIQRVGHGGAGVVYKAWDLVLAHYVALKLIRRPRGGEVKTDSQMNDLVREARNAIRLRHPNIVPVFDVGRIAEECYIAMEFVDGESLASTIRKSREQAKPPLLSEDPARYLRVIRDVADAVHYAHTFPKPIVHCDLKPANVLVDPSGRAYLVDFGLAQPVEVADLSKGSGDQESRLIRGTPAYMPPERLSGKRDEIGVWTDVYGLGAILYELIAGRAMYDGNVQQVLMKAAVERPEPPLERVPADTATAPWLPGLQDVCMACLERDPKRRPPTARDVQAEIDAVLAELEPGAQTPVQDQARAELEHVADQMASLELEVGFREIEALEANWQEGDLAALAADHRRQAKCLEAFKERMIAQLNDKRPRVDRLDLLDRVAVDFEILRATPRKMIAFLDGRTAEIVWPAVKPEGVVHLASDVLGMREPEDRLALGVYCLYGRLRKQARFFLGSLVGTPLEAAAQALLDVRAA